MGVIGASVLWALAVAAGIGPDAGADRLYGRVHTTSGEVGEGYLRWDRNEAGWYDYLDASMEIPPDHLRDAERLDPEFAEAQRRARSLVAFGVRLTWDEDDQSDPPTSPAAMRFAHIASVSVVDARSATVHLVSGEDVVLRSASSDLGRSMRDLVLELPSGEERTYDWGDIETIDFFPAPAGTPAPTADRLYGTLTTRSGVDLTGPISWDLDEILPTDILDGRADGHDLEIPFAQIRSIAWESDRSARVVLTSGEEVVMRGTNDVDRGNRGIEVGDPTFGRVIVEWAEFDSLRFHPAPASRPTTLSAPGRVLAGTVRAVDGRVIEGDLRWDEASFAWQTLRGWSDEVRYDVEFGAIQSIERAEGDRLIVTLRDGRILDLEDGTDVDEGHRGVFVRPEGRALRIVRWRDLQKVDFSW